MAQDIRVRPDFTYDQAFTRNIGWVTEAEQATLRGKRIAIAGLGGVGGSHLLTLVRLGIGAFHITDFDEFGLANFNRQAGAMMSTVDRPKLEVLADMARDINPELAIERFPLGVNRENIDAFLKDVDLFVDGFDFFVLDIRRAVFARCAELGIPAITAAPLGMGVAMLNFLPGGMTFEQYFGLEGRPQQEQYLRFLLGLAPRVLQRGYLADPTRVNFEAKAGPSTAMACQLCAGFAATEALKILLARGPLLSAPHGMHFDAYRYKFVKTWRPMGNANPLQRVALAIAGRQLKSFRAS